MSSYTEIDVNAYITTLYDVNTGDCSLLISNRQGISHSIATYTYSENGIDGKTNIGYI
jgi:hypothetical protein